MANSLHQPSPAYVEEYNEDANITIPGTRQSANIAAKRSKPDIPKLKTAAAERDEASDPPYSSRIGVPSGSGDSSPQTPERKVEQSKKALPQSTGISMPPSPTKGTESRPRSPQKPTVQRTMSRTKREEKPPKEICDCKECAARMRPSGTPVKAKPIVSHHEASHHSRPAQHGPPSLQTIPFPPPPQLYGVPILPAPQPHLRPQPVQRSHRTGRPASFHAGSSYNPPVYIERQAYPNISSQYPLSSSYNAPPVYLPAPSPIASRGTPYPFPGYENHPPVPTFPWTTENSLPISGLSSVYGPPQGIEYPLPQTFYPTVPQVSRHPSTHSGHRSERPSPISPSEEEYFNLRHPRKPQSLQPPTRPAVRHAATTSAAHPALHRSQRRSEEPLVDQYRKQSLEEGRPALRPALSKRPSATPTVGTNTSKNSVRITTQLDRDSAPHHYRRRPESYCGPEAPRQLEEEIENIEAYQAAQASRNGIIHAEPVTTDDIKQVARRRAKTNASGGSEVGSRTSRHSGSSEGKKDPSRTLTDRHRREGDTRSKKDETADGNFTVKFNASQKVKLEFKGDSGGGRTVELRQIRDGEGGMELSIEGKGRKERSERRYPSVVSSRRGNRVDREVEYNYGKRADSRAGRAVSRVPEEEETKVLKEAASTGKVVKEQSLVALRPAVHSRRSSRSVASRTMNEGQPF